MDNRKEFIKEYVEAKGRQGRRGGERDEGGSTWCTTAISKASNCAAGLVASHAIWRFASNEFSHTGFTGTCEQ